MVAVHFTAAESIQLGIAAMIALGLPRALRDRRQLVVLRGVRPRHFVYGVRSLAAFTVVAAVLLATDTPLRWGWWRLFGGTGSVLFGDAQGVHSASPSLSVLGFVCIALLLTQLPWLALAEERKFRRGDELRSRAGRALGALKFGAVHLVLGIPIGAALGIGVAGALFGVSYARGYRVTGNRAGAVLESTRVHLAHNLIIFGVLVSVWLT